MQIEMRPQNPTKSVRHRDLTESKLESAQPPESLSTRSERYRVTLDRVDRFRSSIGIAAAGADHGTCLFLFCSSIATTALVGADHRTCLLPFSARCRRR